MLIKCGFDISFEFPGATPMLLQMHVHPEREGDLLSPERFQLAPSVPYQTYIDQFGNRCTRLVAPQGKLTLSNLFTIRDSGIQDTLPWGARQAPIEELPHEVIVFLLGSRYCDTDLLATKAWALFGKIEGGWPRVHAILDYSHKRIKFGYTDARADRTASQGDSEQVGVCRDYAHLAITLCRCMNIPARYCTGYLGDIGMPPPYAVGDFAAWFEAFIGGRWYTFDPRNNMPRIGRILMARGRDATDVAIVTSFGACTMANFSVFTDEVVSPARVTA